MMGGTGARAGKLSAPWGNQDVQQGAPLQGALLCPIFGLNQSNAQAGDGRWERETDVVNLNRKAQVQLAQKQPVSMRMWLMCLPHKAAGPKKMKSMHGDSMGSRGFHPGVPTSTKCFKVFQTSLSFARTFMVILNIINSEIVLSHDHMT